jgi:hypothetical protein
MKKEEGKEYAQGCWKIQERGGVIPGPPLSYYKRKVWALDHPLNYSEELPHPSTSFPI